MATLPTLAVEVGFASTPATALASTSWTDITAYVMDLETLRGRPNELSGVEPSTARLTLLNNDRRFDPLFTAGAYWPNVKAMRRLRISATWAAVTYRLFTGFVERWPQEWELGNFSTVPIECVDGLEYLRAASVTLTGAPDELSGARIGRILDAAGWPAADRSLDAGQSLVQGGDYSGKALDLIQTVLDTELGLGFISGAGLYVFQDRHRRFKSPYTTPQATFGDSGGAGELPYQRIGGTYDVVEVRNEARITCVGGTEQVSSDSTSQADYLLRSYSKSGLLHVGDVVSKDMADFIVSRYKDPALRFGNIATTPHADPTNLWPKLLGLELGDRITVLRRPGRGTASTFTRSGTTVSGAYTVTGLSSTSDLRPGMAVSGGGVGTGARISSVDSGSQITLTVANASSTTATLTFQHYITLDQHIEAVRHVARPGVWEQTAYQLSPADNNTYWTLGDSVNGVLGVTTRLAF